MKIRLATTADRASIDTMIRLYLVEQRQIGNPVQVTRQTVSAYRDLSEHYLTGRIPGLVIVASEEDGTLCGLVLAGDLVNPMGIESDYGRQAVVSLAWVQQTHRKTRLGLEMLVWGRPLLVELGFDTATMAIREGNEAGMALARSFGAVPSETLLTYPLREETRHG